MYLYIVLEKNFISKINAKIVHGHLLFYLNISVNGVFVGNEIVCSESFDFSEHTENHGNKNVWEMVLFCSYLTQIA